MKRIFTMICVGMVAMALSHCSGRKNAGADVPMASPADVSEAAADAYHELMAQSFHPFMDSGNLMPARAHAEELASAAVKWYESVSAAQSDTTLTSSLRQLTIQSRRFADIVKEGSDETVGKSLEDLHHEFHGVMELWSNELEDHVSK